VATAAAAGATEVTTAARTVPGAAGAATTTVTARGEAPATEVEAATVEKAPRVVEVALAIAAVPRAVEIARESTLAAKAATAMARVAARQMEAHRYRSEEVVVDRSGERFGRCRLVLSAREADRDCLTAGSRLRSRTASTAE
jgi:butyrate kinase